MGVADERDVLTRAEMDAMWERAAKATPGLWGVGSTISDIHEHEEVRVLFAPESRGYLSVALCRNALGPRWRQADAVFIAHAHEDIPRLLATVEALYEIVVRIDPTLCPFHCIPRVVSGSDRDDQGIGTNWYEHAKDCPIPHALLSR